MILLRIVLLSTLIGSSAAACYSQGFANDRPEDRFPKGEAVDAASFAAWRRVFFYVDVYDKREKLLPSSEGDAVFKAAFLAIENEKLKELKHQNVLLAQLLAHAAHGQSPASASAQTNLSAAALLLASASTAHQALDSTDRKSPAK